MKTEFDFDPSQCFGNRARLRATVWPMHYPFLITHAFGGQRQTSRDVPESLIVVLNQCCERIAADAKQNPDHLHGLVTRSLKAGISETGVLGVGDLPLEELYGGRAYVNMTLPLLPNAKIQLRRFGDCIGIRVVNDRDDPHEKFVGILSRLAKEGLHYVCYFNQRYGFRLTPDLSEISGTYVLDVQAELAVMDRYLPDIRWFDGKKSAALLHADFTSHERAGVKVGTYGDAEVFARITYEREIDDHAWRFGKVRSMTATELVFGAGAGDKPQIEYFIQTVEPDRSYEPARADINYPCEQGLLHDLAGMLYTGLYQRAFQSMIGHGNQHLLKFRREPEQTGV